MTKSKTSDRVTGQRIQGHMPKQHDEAMQIRSTYMVGLLSQEAHGAREEALLLPYIIIFSSRTFSGTYLKI